MRPISDNINAPNSKVAKWLLKKFQELPKPFNFSVKNAKEFVDRLVNVEIEQDEIMVSFDVTSLYPNVPIDESLMCAENWLKKHRDKVDNVTREMYMDMLKLCTRNSFFQFDGRFYDQEDRVAMGSVIGPFVASDIFLGNMEEEISNEVWFPKFWARFIDDIFAIVKKNELDSILEKLNSKYGSIEFTYVMEEDGVLPFLDVKVIRCGKTFTFEIYRKDTMTMRYITSDSYHCFEQKIAAFNSMVYRMINIPMKDNARMKEKKYIYETASVNGFDDSIIDKLINKHERSKLLRDQTTLNLLSQGEKRKYIRVNYFPFITDKMTKVLKNVNIVPGFTSCNQIKKVLCCNKDKIDKDKRSGIYKVLCDFCKDIYVGQTSRPYCVRCNEHFKSIDKVIDRYLNELCAPCKILYFKNSKKPFCFECNDKLKVFHDENELSAVAKHFKNYPNHKITNKSKLVKQVIDDKLLDSWESYFMFKYSDDLMNDRPAPIASSLFKYFV